MAGTKRSMPFERTGPFPIDDTLVLSKAQMLAVSDVKMPEKYFAVCKDDGKMYVYDKSATASLETGKFSVVSGEEIPINTALISWNNTTREEPTSVRIAHKTGPSLARTDFTDVQDGVSVELRTPLSNTTKVLASKEYVDSIIPSDGEEGQILTKVSETGAEWGVDTGAELVKYGRQYGMMPYDTTITQLVATFVSQDPRYQYSRKFSVPTGGVITDILSFRSGIFNTFDMYVTFTGYEERKVISTYNLEYQYASVENTSLDLAIRNINNVESGKISFETFGYATGVERAVEQIRLVAKNGNNFGGSSGTTPYDIRNLTGMVLDDLKLTGNAIPTDWGIAESGVIKVRNVTPTVSGEYRWDLSGYGFTNTGDYNIFVDIVGGTGGFADAIWSFVKRTDSASIYAKGATANVTEIDFSYVLVAKGYGNNTMSGGGGGGGSVDVDSAMSDSSTNPVQNNVIKGYVDNAVADKTEMSYDSGTDTMTVQDNSQSLALQDSQDSFNVTATSPNAYFTAELAKKDYVDTELAAKQDAITGGTANQVLMKSSSTDGAFNWQTLHGSAWGVAKIGSGSFSNTLSTTVNISDLGFTSANDYDVILERATSVTVLFRVSSKTATSFTVALDVPAGYATPNSAYFKYTIIAVGYGASIEPIPDGGTTGQVLTKASNADGDVTWSTPSGGGEDEILFINVNGSDFVQTQDPNVQTMTLSSPYTVADLQANAGLEKPKTLFLRIKEISGGTDTEYWDIPIFSMGEAGYYGGQQFLLDMGSIGVYTYGIKLSGGDTVLTRTLYALPDYASEQYVDTALDTKQDALVSGTNIKTVNGNSLLGSGDIQISGSGVPSYEVSNNDNGGNVVKVGEYIENGVTYGIYEFYYKTGALPNTTTKAFSLATLLADYTILEFMGVHGITSNGICIGSGRIDGTNIIVVQQFSKNNKTFTVRSYQDFSGATARVCIKFIGTKNS